MNKLTNKGYQFITIDQTRKVLSTTLYRAWFPKGETGEIKTNGCRKNINLLGALTNKGKTLFTETKTNFKSEVTIHFLKILQNRFGEKIAVILDNAPYFASRKVKNFAKNTKIELIYLPKYSPDMNPVEECWRQLKQKQANQLFKNKQELRENTYKNLNQINPPKIANYLQ